jgi:hypothetical protein
MTFAEAVTHDLGSAVLCLSLDHHRQRLLAGTADGHAVALHLSALSSFPLADSAPASVVHRWRPHPGARTRSIAVSPMRPEGDAEEEEDCYVVTGGSDGEIVQMKLARDASFPKDVGSGGALQPSHNGQVVALQPVGPLLISGAQDGTMRIWDMRTPSTKDRMRQPPRDGPRCLYGLGVCACMRERERARVTEGGWLHRVCAHRRAREERGGRREGKGGEQGRREEGGRGLLQGLFGLFV